VVTLRALADTFEMNCHHYKAEDIRINFITDDDKITCRLDFSLLTLHDIEVGLSQDYMSPLIAD